MGARTQRGFTLIELMTVVTILAVLIAVGLPGLKSLIANQKVKTAASNLQAYLNLTRGEALKRNTNIMLSPIQGSDWTSGWKITDSGGNSLYVAPAVAAVTITGPVAIIYQGVGRPALSSDQTFKISASGTTTIKCVDVTLSGMARVSNSGC